LDELVRELAAGGRGNAGEPKSSRPAAWRSKQGAPPGSLPGGARRPCRSRGAGSRWRLREVWQDPVVDGEDSPSEGQDNPPRRPVHAPAGSSSGDAEAEQGAFGDLQLFAIAVDKV
jgi:hypothetical protein